MTEPPDRWREAFSRLEKNWNIERERSHKINLENKRLKAEIEMMKIDVHLLMLELNRKS